MAEHPLDPRLAAARAVADVVGRGRSLSAALPPLLARVGPGERALAQELAYGTLRFRPRLAALLGRLLDKPMKAKEREVEALLLIGLYQLLYLDLPPHAAVSETVNSAGRLGKPWARGLVNGVLRNAQRRGAALLAELDSDPAVALAHPPWLLAALREAWPEAWRAIAEANNMRPPMTLRVNQRRGSREAYLGKLDAAGLEAAPAPHTEAGITLARPVAVERLPGFGAGEVSVQDGAAQLAAQLLDARRGMRVLDACAAPGGKTAHILERGERVELLAIDSDAERLARVQENLDRLGLSATLTAADAGDPGAWWDGEPFDRILLDAPCSATGVIRRHPDIKTLRREADIAALTVEQERLLHALWPTLAPGGLLVYATCSILPQENAHLVAAFLEAQQDARAIPINAAWGHPAQAGRQILPGEDGMDGFFYVCLTKQ